MAGPVCQNILMRMLARVATSSLWLLCAGLILAVAAEVAISIVGIQASTRLENSIASDELTTSTATGQLAQDMDAAYTAGREAFAAGPVQRARLFGSLYAHLLPAADSQLSYLAELHAGDPPAEQATFGRFARQWAAVRDLLSPASITAAHPATQAAQLTAAYQPVSAALSRLLQKEKHDGHSAQTAASADAAQTIGWVAAAAAVGIAAGLLLLLSGITRIRRNLKPAHDQAEFVDTLQIANDEDEAHRLLQRHLERTLAAMVVVLNRNNSADRLEAVTPLPDGSPLKQTLRGAEPRACLAVRAGRTHRQDQQQVALLSCPVCTGCPGKSSCIPLTVAGEVMGAVLLYRGSAYTDAEEQRIRESVSQAAPVLANLRNLAIAEIRAATDGLTGLPNKRAAADALKRMFAQASTTGAPLSLLLLDLDHFKQVNDQRGHAVGDQVLANVGATLHTVLRAHDFAARNGGEEFAVLLPDTGLPAAAEIAERIRVAITEISLPGADVSVTVSIGVSSYPDHASTPDRLERLADGALYSAKRHGRNRVELADPASAEMTAGLLKSAANGSHTDPHLPQPATPIP
jgi:diguanylate cyclase (GGDEF)-like protein